MVLFMDKLNINSKTIIYISIILFLTLLVSKIIGYISWSWWLVTLPLWIWPALFIIVIVCCFIGFIIAGLFKIISTLFEIKQ